MFGCHAVYGGEKILLVLRDRADHEDCNGVWIATDKMHHAYLQKLFPKMRSVSVLGGSKDKVTNWQMIGKEDPDFEKYVYKLCEMILHGDKAIGRIPAKKRKKN